MNKQNELNPIAISGRYFTMGTKDTVTAFASDIGPLSKGFPFLCPMYKDAADVGMVIQSERTGNRVRFYLEEEVVVEGSVTMWTFTTGDRGPVNGITKAIIYND